MKKLLFITFLILFSVFFIYSEDSGPDDIGLYFDSFMDEFYLDFTQNGNPPYSYVLNTNTSNKFALEIRPFSDEYTGIYSDLNNKDYINLKISSSTEIESDTVYLLFDEPLKIPGVCKTVSFFCKSHTGTDEILFADIITGIVIEDCIGIEYQIPAGYIQKESFHKYTVYIPVFIRQRSFHITDNIGITLCGFVFTVYPEEERVINIDVMEITAVSDTYDLDFYAPDEIPRGW
jgi:hypothetical protein